MTFQPTTASEARAVVAFTKSGCLTAAMAADERIRRNRDALLCEMAVAQAWAKEARVLPQRPEPKHCGKVGTMASAAVRKAKSNAAVIAALKAGADGSYSVAEAMGCGHKHALDLLTRMKAEGLIEGQRINGSGSRWVFWLKDAAQ